MGYQVIDRRPGNVTRQTFGIATAVHFFSALCFVAMVAAELEGCDAGDGAVLALLLAMAVDLTLTAVVVATMYRRTAEHRPLLLGWAAGLIPALLGLVAAAVYIGGLGSGCPV
ncbi:hypothetical protein [Actinoplanes sp. NPDC049118]|uniref:hypothetical protein n=1 Tax=Actinoplanes sp. NPDC049118 TaxID=3155769 RepID=UPI003402535C